MSKPEIFWDDPVLYPIPNATIRLLAEDDKPFTEWDQYTTCKSAEDVTTYPDGTDKPPKFQQSPFLTPSKLPNKYITVYGEGSLYCVKLTLDELMELYWRINHIYFRFIPAQIPITSRSSAGQPKPSFAPDGTRPVYSEVNQNGSKSFGGYSYDYYYSYDNYDSKASGAEEHQSDQAVERAYKKDDLVSGKFYLNNGEFPKYLSDQSGIENKLWKQNWWEGRKVEPKDDNLHFARDIGMYTGYGANQQDIHGDINTSYLVELSIANNVADRFDFAEENLPNPPSQDYNYGASSHAILTARMDARVQNFILGSFDCLKINNNEYWWKPLNYVDVNYYVGASSTVGYQLACDLGATSFEKIDAYLRTNNYNGIKIKTQPNLLFNHDSEKPEEYYQGSWYDSAVISIKLSNRKVEGRYFLQAAKYSRQDGSAEPHDYCPDQYASASATLGAFNVPELSFTVQKWLAYLDRYGKTDGKIIPSKAT